MTTDPKRLFDTEGGDLAAAIGAARRRTADPSRMTAMGARLADAGVLPPDGFAQTAASASTTSLAPAAAPAFSKWLITGIGVGGVASLALIASLFATRSEASDASAQGKAVANPVPTLELRRQTAPGVAPDPEPLEAREASKHESPEVVNVTGADAMPLGATAATPRALAPKSETAPSSAAKAEESEVQLLKGARDALGSNPARALSLVERARSRFPKSTFGQEREFITISALYRLGRRAEAQTREQSFRSRYPKSAYIPQLDRLASRP